MLGGPAGVAARAMAAGIADEVTALPASERSDAVVAYADAPQAIHEIAACVAPNGVLYLEVDRNRRGTRETTPRQVEAVLHAAGLTACTWYAVEPDLTHARAYVPLHLPHAMSWHRRMHAGDGAAMRFADILRRSAVRVGGPGVAALNRSYAVVAAAGEHNPLPHLLSHAGVSALLGASGSPAGSAMLTYGGDRVLLFPFSADGREPMSVVKVPKTRLLAERTANEQTQMHALRSTLDPALSVSIPEPLGAVEVSGLLVACERYVRGMSVGARAVDPGRSLDEKRDDLRLAMDWLARFHRATVSGVAPIERVSREVIVPLLDDYALAFGETGESRLFDGMRSAAATLGNAPVSIGRQHRDFAVWNVLRDRDTIAVVDWEGARDGISACDAVHLVSTWLYMVRLGDGVDDEARCTRELFLRDVERDAAASAARDAFAWYLDAMRLDARLASLLIATHRVELAVRRSSQRHLHGADRGSNRGPESEEVRVVRALATEAAVAFASVDAAP